MTLSCAVLFTSEFLPVALITLIVRDPGVLERQADEANSISGTS